jgi:N-acetylglutamate synthase-like GNAT family acetyltransferase
MIKKLQIARVESLPLNLDDEIVPVAKRENFRAIEWLKNDWQKGVNRFDKPGEAFYVARLNDHLVGVCGVNRDPFVGDASIARLRRLYVLPQYRRLGIGRQLVLRAQEDARKHFIVIRLRTTSEEAGVFFESVGFAEIEGDEQATLEKRID